MLTVYGKQTESTASLQLACGTALQLGLRWGGQQVSSAVNGSVHLLNGLEQLQALQAAGVKCPTFTSDYCDTASWPTDAVILGRKFNHTQGRDIISLQSCNTRKKFARFQERDFFTQYVQSEAEWRLHVIKFTRGYRVIARSLKEFDTNYEPPMHLQTGIVVRSRRLGWKMRHDVEPLKGLRSIAKAATQACGYELGAVDILDLGVALSPEQRWMVLEVNSRPAMRDNYTITAYAQAMRILAGEKV